MKIIFTVVLLLILSVFTSNIFAQAGGNSFNFIGAGARAAGMGYAFIGVSDDATAISWNPAGLSQLIRPELSTVFKLNSRDVEYKDYLGQTSSYSLSSLRVNFASFVYPLGGNLNPVIAASFQNQLDYSYKFEENETSIESNVGVNTFSVGFSMKFNLLHVGIAVNRWFSVGEEKYNNYILNGFIYNGTSTPSFSGTSFSIGALLDFENLSSSAPLKFGLRFTPAYELENEVTQKFDLFDDKFITKIEMPSSLGFGVSFRVLDALTIAGDYEIISAKDRKIRNPILGTSGLSSSDEDLNQYRLGAEYLIITESIIIPLRAGYKNNPTLLADIELDSFGNAVFGDQVVGTSYNFGIGLIFNDFSFDLAYEYFDYLIQDKVNGVNESDTFNFFTLSGIFYF